MTYQQAQSEAIRRSMIISSVPCHGFAVQVIHEEGTTLFYESANCEKLEDWWLVYTEHHGIHVYHDSEVDILKYKRIWDAEKISGEDE